MFKRYFVFLATCLLPSVFGLSAASAVGLEDPTLPLEMRGKSGVRVNLQLNSVLIAKDRKVAIINGHVISEGQTVEGIRVVSIADRNVQVVHQGQLQTLSMGNSVVGVRK